MTMQAAQQTIQMDTVSNVNKNGNVTLANVIPINPKDYYNKITSIPIENIARELLVNRITVESPHRLECDCPNHPSQGQKSLHINLREQCWYCFGCHLGGDVLHLVEFCKFGTVTKEHRGTMPASHRQARDFLAAKIGLPPLSSYTHNNDSLANIEGNYIREVRAKEVLTQVANYYHSQLTYDHSENKEIYEGLKKRGITQETIDKLKIGYANNNTPGWMPITLWIGQQGYSDEELLSSGAFFKDYNEDIIKPMFNNRLIFPYWSQGQVVYLIGRETKYTNDYFQGKYVKLQVHSDSKPWVSTAINNNNLYNEDILLTNPKKLIITEGVIDCIHLMQHGFDVISPVTANIKNGDWERILRKLNIAGFVYLTNDNEYNEVGRKASITAARKLLERGIETYIVELPLGEAQIKARERLKEADKNVITIEKKERKSLEAQAKIDVNDYFLQGHTPNDFLCLMDDSKTLIDHAIDQLPRDITKADAHRIIQDLLKEIYKLSAIKQEKYLNRIQDRCDLKKATLKEQMKQIAQECKIEAKEKAKQEKKGQVHTHLSLYQTPEGGLNLPAIAEYFIQKYQPFTIADVPFVYIDGYYSRRTSFLESEIQAFLGFETTNKRISEIYNYILRWRKLEADQIDTYAMRFINVRNGMLEWETGNLYPHHPSYLSTLRFPITYNPHAQCPCIDKFLTTTLDETLSPLIEELFGYLLIPDASRDKWFICTGGGENGKSTFLDLFNAAIGESNISHVSLHDIAGEDKFALSRLFGKVLNSYDDLSADVLRRTGELKIVSSGKTISAQEKFKDMFSFRPFARFLISCNELPHTTDRQHAFFRRILIIPFNKQFKRGENAVGNLISYLTTEQELAGLLNRGLVGLRRLYANDCFSEPDISRQALEDYKLQADPVRSFINERCKLSPDGMILKRDLFQEYTKYCEESKFRGLGVQKFYKHLTTVQPEVKDFKTGGQRYFKGIEVLNENSIVNDLIYSNIGG